MRILPSSAPQPSGARRIFRRWLRAGLCAGVLVMTFLVGAYAKWRHWDWTVARTVQAAISAAPPYVESLIGAEPLETVRLDVKFKHVQKLQAKRDEALKTGWLHASDEDFVPASLTVGMDSMPARIRLKGDGLDHWQGDSWSFRVKVEGEQRPFGMRIFSLQHPKSRWYLNEWCFLATLQAEGVLAVRYRFVNVLFNGEDKGIYALEEHFDKLLVESQQRRAGVILAFEEQPNFHADVQLRDAGGHVGTQFSHIRSQVIRVFSESAVNADSALRAQADEAIELLRAYQEGRRPASEVFDVELLGRYYALVDLWRASHASFWCNLRYYFNPITSRLEPIGFDSMALWGEADRPLVSARGDDYTDNAALADPVIAAVYLRELARVSTPEYLDSLRAKLTPEFDRWRLALQREFPNETRIQPPWETVAARQQYIRRALSFERHVVAAVRPDQNGLIVDLRSIALVPVEIVGFRLGEAVVTAELVSAPEPRFHVANPAATLVTLAPQQADQPIELTTFHVFPDESATKEATLTVLTRYIGSEHTIAQVVQFAPARGPRGGAPQPPTLAAACAQHPFLEADAEGALRVRPGAWTVTGDLVLPANAPLTIPAGAHLSFAPGAVLFASGPLHLTGTPELPVVLDASAGNWGGIIVIDAYERCHWENAMVRDTAAFARGGWMVTGGTTFYESDLALRNVHFEHSAAEDGLNVFRGDIDFQDVYFANCASDAFDGDFVTGKVAAAHFTDITGDGLDVSGSQLSVCGVTARRVADKAISVGERSRVEVTDLAAATCGFALAAKDDSDAVWRRGTVRNARVAVGAYVKKAEFGTARAEAHDIQIIDSNQSALVQTGCSVRLNGQDIAAQDLDVQKLYANAPAKPRPVNTAASPVTATP